MPKEYEKETEAEVKARRKKTLIAVAKSQPAKQDFDARIARLEAREDLRDLK